MLIVTPESHRLVDVTGDSPKTNTDVACTPEPEVHNTFLSESANLELPNGDLSGLMTHCADDGGRVCWVNVMTETLE